MTTKVLESCKYGAKILHTCVSGAHPPQSLPLFPSHVLAVQLLRFGANRAYHNGQELGICVAEDMRNVRQLHLDAVFILINS